VPTVIIFECCFLAFAVFTWPTEFAIALATTASARRRSSIALWRDRLFWAVLGNLAITVWALVPHIALDELIRIKGRGPHTGPWLVAAYLTVWLLPMALVGLALASARLSVLAQWLRTRSRVGFVAGALALIRVGQLLWIWRWAPRPDAFSAADWDLAIQRQLFSSIVVTAGLIAITLWAMPSRAGKDDEDLLSYAGR
jgi:hypothetical protein